MLQVTCSYESASLVQIYVYEYIHTTGWMLWRPIKVYIYLKKGNIVQSLILFVVISFEIVSELIIWLIITLW